MRISPASALQTLSELGSSLRHALDRFIDRDRPQLALLGNSGAASPHETFGDLDVAFSAGSATASAALTPTALRKRVESKLSRKVAKELSDLNSWSPIAKAIKDSGASLRTTGRIFEEVNKLRPTLIEAIHSQRGWKDLVTVFARGQDRQQAYFAKGGPEATIKMVDAVQRSTKDRDRVGELLKIMATYDGDPIILKSFLLKLCEAKDLPANPFEAGRRVQIRYPALADIPRHLRVKGTDAEGRTIYRVKAEGGQMLTTSEIYQIEDPKDPSTPFISGHQAATKIFDAFARERTEEMQPEVVATRRDTGFKNALRDLFVDQAEDVGPTHAKQAGKTRRLSLEPLDQVIDRLQTYIQQLRGEGYKLTVGDQLLDFNQANSLVEAVGTGTLLTRLTKKIGTGAIPEAVELALAAYQDPRLKASPQAEARLARAIAAYVFLTEPVDKEAHLAPLLTDLQAYTDFRAKHGDAALTKMGVPCVDVDNARAKVSTILDSGTSETTLANLAAIKSAFGFVDTFRRAVNRAEVGRYGPELLYAAQHFEPLFMVEGRLMPDAMRPSVPVQRLSEHAYGMKIWRAASWRAPTALLTREEFGAIKEYIRLRVVAPDLDRQVAAMNVVDFKETLARVIVAHRKIQDMQRALRKLDQDPASFDFAKDGEKLAAIKNLDVLTGSHFRPAEHFAESHDLALGEVRIRVESRPERGLLANVTRVLDAGLWDPGPQVTALYEGVKNLTPATNLEPDTELAQQLAFARKIQGLAPLVRVDFKLDFVDSAYLTPDNVKALRMLWEFKETFDASSLADDYRAPALKTLAETMGKQMFLTGEHRLGHKWLKFQHNYGRLPESVFIADGKIKYASATALEAEHTRRTNEFIPGKDLDASFWDKFRETVKGSRVRFDLTRFEAIKVDENLLVQRSFVESFVEQGEASQGRSVNVPRTEWIGNLSKLFWVSGEPTFNFGKYAGQSIIEVAARNPGYLHGLVNYTWELVSPQTRADHLYINKIAAHILEHHLPKNGERRTYTRSDFKDIEGFKVWLRTNYPPPV